MYRWTVIPLRKSLLSVRSHACDEDEDEDNDNGDEDDDDDDDDDNDDDDDDDDVQYLISSLAVIHILTTGELSCLQTRVGACGRATCWQNLLVTFRSARESLSQH